MKRGVICCECSGRVREEFRKLGFDFYSCDLKPAEDDSPYHIQADFRSVVQESWDFVGYHYTCRVMANSGVRWLKGNPDRWIDLENACEVFNLTLSDSRPGYSENPIQHCYAKARILREQNQVIQPWWFGDPYFKATCLWLRNVPPLRPTDKLNPPKSGSPEHKRWSAVHFASPGPNRATERSRTYPGIARAIADQWKQYV